MIQFNLMFRYHEHFTLDSFSQRPSTLLYTLIFLHFFSSCQLFSLIFFSPLFHFLYYSTFYFFSDFEELFRAGILFLINDNKNGIETAHEIVNTLSENHEIEYDTVWKMTTTFSSLFW